MTATESVRADEKLFKHELTELHADVLVLKEQFESLYRHNADAINQLRIEVSKLTGTVDALAQTWTPAIPDKPITTSERVRQGWSTKATILGIFVGTVIVEIIRSFLR